MVWRWFGDGFGVANLRLDGIASCPFLPPPPGVPLGIPRVSLGDTPGRSPGGAQGIPHGGGVILGHPGLSLAILGHTGGILGHIVGPGRILGHPWDKN